MLLGKVWWLWPILNHEGKDEVQILLEWKAKKLLRGRRKTDCLAFISPKSLQRQMGYCAFPELQRWVIRWNLSFLQQIKGKLCGMGFPHILAQSFGTFHFHKPDSPLRHCHPTSWRQWSSTKKTALPVSAPWPTGHLVRNSAKLLSFFQDHSGAGKAFCSSLRKAAKMLMDQFFVATKTIQSWTRGPAIYP